MNQNIIQNDSLNISINNNTGIQEQNNINISQSNNLNNNESTNLNNDESNNLNNDESTNLNTDESTNMDELNNLDINKSNSYNSNYSSEDNITITDDLTASVDTVNEDNDILNNYKYSEDSDENIEITVSEFVKLYEIYPEISSKLTQIKSNINLLPNLMKFLKEKNHRLALNILDEPKVCFEKIFNIINDNYMIEYQETIEQIQSILPNYDKHLIYEALQVNNNNVESAINYLYDY